MVYSILVNMQGQDKVGMKDFELLKVLGTGGKSANYNCEFIIIMLKLTVIAIYDKCSFFKCAVFMILI